LVQFYLFIVGVTSVSSFNPTVTPFQYRSTTLSAKSSSNDEVLGRSAFFQKATAACMGIGLAGRPLPSWAKEDPALKGTKSDPKYQGCLSACIYDCTKPKGDEQKSRAECIPECKQKCATSKEQLMTGSPKKD